MRGAWSAAERRLLLEVARIRADLGARRPRGADVIQPRAHWPDRVEPSPAGRLSPPEAILKLPF